MRAYTRVFGDDDGGHMASRKKSRDTAGGERASEAMRDTAQKIWLAGLGAFERAKGDGPKMFETLVEQGRNLGVKAREGADQALRAMRETAYAGGAGRWDKLEQVFEDRVAKSLQRLGVLTTKEVDDLARQVKDLNENVRDLMRRGAGASKPAGRSKASAGRRKKASGAKRRSRTKKAAKT
jgi:poly(hydroxyalkanoate) granule-associated protein